MNSIAEYIDYTLLKPNALKEDFLKLCAIATEYDYKGICVPLNRLELCKKNISSMTTELVTVVGFPLGYGGCKAAQTQRALNLGATEIDMVIAINDLLDGKTKNVLAEIIELKKICGNRTLKVIVETCYLETSQIKQVTEIVIEAGADFIKTSTGFGSQGANLNDIELMQRCIAENNSGLKIKASGGIKNYHQACDFINLGVKRIGTSQILHMPV
jgi:deoxyribose-phosphate aldolase